MRSSSTPDLSKYDEIAARKDIPVEPYKPRVQAVVDELKGRDEIVVTKCEVKESTLSADDLAAARKRYMFVDDHMAQFYSEFDSISITWQLKSDACVAGTMGVYPLSTVFSSWKNNMWYEETELMFLVKPVDWVIPEAGCGLKLPRKTPQEPNTSCPMVFFEQGASSYNEMNLSFGGYIDLMLKSRGYWYWFSAICADQGNWELQVEPRNFRKHIPKLFPDVKVSDFLQRHEELLAADAAAEAREQSSLTRVKKALEGVSCKISITHGCVCVVIDANDADNVTKAKAVARAEFGDDISGLKLRSVKRIGRRSYRLEE